MIQRSPRNALYRFFNGLQYVSISLVPVVGGLTKLPTDQLSKWKTWLPIIEPIGFYVQNEAWWLLLLLSGLAGISKFACAYIGEPWVWKTIQTTLDELQSHAFKQNADPLHHHRVTLFKHKQFRFRVKPWRSKFWPWGKYRWPLSGWLVPVARSGYTTQKTKTVFLAPDDADAAEGVAGQAWCCNWMIPVSGLPDLYANQTTENIEAYAKSTWLRSDLVKMRLVNNYAMARSYLGIPIEVKGRRWGVLVLDSRSPDGIWSPEGLRYETYKVMAKFLERLLERG
jgi:hypothetical protein